MFSDSYKPRISGVVNAVEGFSEELRRRGHRVYIVAPAAPGYADSDRDVVRVPSVTLRRYPDFPLAPPWMPRAGRRLAALGLDVVHTHTPFLMGRVAAGVARRSSAPLVFTHHTLYTEYVHYVPLSAAVTRPAVRWYTTAFCNQCDCVIAPSRAVHDRLRAAGVRARIEVLTTGALTPEVFAPRDASWVRARFGIPAGAPLVVHVGRLGREKSVDDLLRAFARVAPEHDAHLLVVGGGPQEKALRDLAAQLGIAVRVTFAGPMPRVKALDCYAAGDLFATASRTETAGLVITEAMAVGLPVVAVASGGVPEAVADGETGLLAGDVEGLATVMRALLRDPGRRRRLAAQARERARTFSIEGITTSLLVIYESVQATRRPRTGMPARREYG
ncbi:MAG: glycosyltransferase [Armatimonadetes bacterium]|nr:glycosyltransferase [Armatimonadota bacterium]